MKGILSLTIYHTTLLFTCLSIWGDYTLNLFCCCVFNFSCAKIGLYVIGKWDGKRKSKSFWQSFKKSQKGVVRQISKGTSNKHEKNAFGFFDIKNFS